MCVIPPQVSTNSTVIYVKELVAKHLQIPVCQQKLVFKGKTLSDHMSLEDYDISEGNKIHLFAIESSVTAADNQSSPQQQRLPSELTNTQKNQFLNHLTQVLQKYYTTADAAKIVDEFRRNLQSDVNELSLDDIERLAKLKLTQQQI
ncbi:unnamed protein product [Medioppia subpectinata]|uniref:Ubiquitin-like domain-containing protein n=1 Tax=Medioppia subpectinata TaxID=1979941 RepID=A0A7R9PXD0_9ACAR|nr:unnamed protein product [Medioppia subpectinata]CAG2104264.1 unnamed protein product [Medioppia subpectinata]